MKQLNFTDVKKYEIVNIKPPRIKNEDDVLIELKALGLCGTDVHIFMGSRKVDYPHVSGHECVGYVKEVGNKVSKVKPGDYVTVDPNTSCGKCIKCKAGRKNLCVKKDTFGLNIPGCFREMMVAPEKNIYKVPESISLEEGVVIETATVALGGVKKADIKLGQEVIVMGAGSVGLLAMQLVKNLAGKVSIADINQERLNLAKKLGADKTYNVKEDNLPEQYFDAVIDAAGVEATISNAVKIVTSGGKIVLVGIPGTLIKVDIFSVVRNEIEIYGSVACTTEFPEVIKLIEKGNLKVKELVTHKLSFEEIVKGLELMEKKEALKPAVLL